MVIRHYKIIHSHTEMQRIISLLVIDYQYIKIFINVIFVRKVATHIISRRCNFVSATNNTDKKTQEYIFKQTHRKQPHT